MQTRNLYQRWQSLAQRYESDLALHELESGRSWTFGDLVTDVAKRPDAGRVVCASGTQIDSVLETIWAWRDGAIFCAYETEPPSKDWFMELPENIVHVKLSNGSSSTERTFLLTEDQVAADGDQIVSAMGLRRDWPTAGCLSLAHSYGFSNMVLPLLLHGIPLIWMGDAFPGSLDQTLRSFGEVTLPAVPVLWRTWLDSGILDQRIRLALSAGAPLPLELEREIFERCGLKVHNFYGASECGGIAYDSSEAPRSESMTLGAALPGVEVSVEDAGLKVRSPGVAEWMWGRDERRKLGGSCLLGDSCEMDGEMVTLQKTRGDLINVAARKVIPATVERVLEQVNGVEFAVVFGTPSRDPCRMEEVCACLSLKEDLEMKAVRAEVRRKLLRYELPERWLAWSDMTPLSPAELPREDWRSLFSSMLQSTP